MCTGGENSLILIKLYIYVQIFYMVRLPSKKKKKKKNPDLSTHFFFWHVTGNILIFFFLGPNGKVEGQVSWTGSLNQFHFEKI